MKTNTILLAFAITVVAAIGLFASNLGNAEQYSGSPFAVLSSSAGPPATIDLVRDRGGGKFRGGRGFRGSHGFRGRYFRGPFGPYFYGGWGGIWDGGYYMDPYYWQTYCLDSTWDEDSGRWVCNYPIF